jgi:hypothetical protein
MAALAEGGHDHGALVQQILETQKELEDVNKRQQHKTAVEIVSLYSLILIIFTTIWSMCTYLCLEWGGIKFLQVFLFLHAFFDYSCNK